MNKFTRTQITINTSELTLIKKLQGTAQADCQPCGARVEMVTPEQAVTLTGIASRAIYGWVESGQVHFLETAEGHLLICLDSLRATQQDSLRQTGSLDKRLLSPTEVTE